MLIGSNVLTGYFASRFSDKDWERRIEQVSGPAYREAGFIEGYYKANFDFCLRVFGPEYHYRCLEAAIFQYANEYHKRFFPGHWDWQRVKGNGYN